MPGYVGITEKEEEIIKLLVKYQHGKRPIAAVADVLHVSPGTVRNALYRLRRRYDKAVDFVTRYREWRKKMPKRRYL